MRVFVLCSGEFSEGHSPDGVFTTLARAQAALGYALRWEEQDGEDGNTWRARLNGVDELWIYAMEVQS